MRKLSIALAVALAWLSDAATQAQTGKTRSFHFENDVLAGTDRHYTNGLRYASVQGTEDAVAREAPWWGRRLAGHFKLCGELAAGEEEAGCLRLARGYAVTHLIYTPRDLTRFDLIVDDRPYGGWLHYDSVMDLGNLDTRHHFELGLGIVGELSGAEAIQKWIHRDVVSSQRPNGWEHQLDDEPTLQALYSIEHRWKDWTNEDGTVRYFDLVPHGLATVGNAWIFVEAGATARLGINLTGFAAGPITPVAAAEAERPTWEAYFFARGSGRAVARNIFLDGNTFSDSHSVDKENFVVDYSFGVAIRFRRYQLTYTLVTRGSEFRGQQGEHHFASINLTVLPRAGE